MRPLVDGLEHLTTEAPAGARVVDMTADEFTFAFDADAAAGGDVAFAIENVGEEPHEVVIERVPADLDIAGAIQAYLETGEDPEGTEAVAYVQPIAPGEEMTLVFTGPLPAGRYAVLCFVADTEDPEGTPHAAKGIFGEFTVGE